MDRKTLSRRENKQPRRTTSGIVCGTSTAPKRDRYSSPGPDQKEIRRRSKARTEAHTAVHYRWLCPECTCSPQPSLCLPRVRHFARRRQLDRHERNGEKKEDEFGIRLWASTNGATFRNDKIRLLPLRSQHLVVLVCLRLLVLLPIIALCSRLSQMPLLSHNLGSPGEREREHWKRAGDQQPASGQWVCDKRTN